MPTFPRGTGAKPRLITPPRFPDGLQSWGVSGKWQFRAIQNMGRTWEEVYPVLNASLATVRALFQALNQAIREGTLWDVQHLYWQTRLGAGGGTPLVNGASQTGSNLVIDGASPSITNWLRQGDIIQVAGGQVVFDVAGDVNTNGSGQATIPISPPIFVGHSPANDAAVTIDPTAIYFKAFITNVADFPALDVPRTLDAGLTVRWREQPQ